MGKEIGRKRNGRTSVWKNSVTTSTKLVCLCVTIPVHLKLSPKLASESNLRRCDLSKGVGHMTSM